MYHIEIDLASKRPKQDDDEELDFDEKPQKLVLTPEAHAQLEEVMNMLALKRHGMAENFNRRRTQLRENFPAKSSKNQRKL